MARSEESCCVAVLLLFGAKTGIYSVAHQLQSYRTYYESHHHKLARTIHAEARVIEVLPAGRGEPCPVTRELKTITAPNERTEAGPGVEALCDLTAQAEEAKVAVLYQACAQVPQVRAAVLQGVVVLEGKVLLLRGNIRWVDGADEPDLLIECMC
jgi:hypothetical protein